MIGTGARPIRPDLPGIDEPWVHGVQTLEDGRSLLGAVERGRCRDVIIVGAGYIGLEMAEAFHRRGAQVTLVDANDHVMGRTLDPDLSECLGDALAKIGVRRAVGRAGRGVRGRSRCITGTGALPADLVVLGLGVEPNSQLAEEAGLRARRPRRDPRRSAPAGERRRRVRRGRLRRHRRHRRRPAHLPRARHRRQPHGPVAGINLGGGYATFPGVVGTAVTKVCDFEVGRTGLTEQQAIEAGFGAITVTIDSTVRAGYFPGAEPVTVKLVAEVRTGRLLGGQIVGGPGAAKRIDVLATALYAGLTVADLVDVDLSYAPPFSPVWDPVQAAARKALSQV